MVRTAGNGYRKIRRLEDEALAKADGYIKRMYAGRSANFSKKDRHNNVDAWRYRLVNGHWQQVIEQQEQTSA